LKTWLLKWRNIFQNVEVTETQIGVYVETLFDLRPQQVDEACAAATKIAEFFPTPAAIRKHVRVEWESPDLLHGHNPDWKQLPAPKFTAPEPHVPPPARREHPAKTADEQIAEMLRKGWLQ
jgi:hypothetical protein